MVDGFIVTVNEDSVEVDLGKYTLEFGKDEVGLESYRYFMGTGWHEGVETGGEPAILFGPHFYADGMTGDYLYPSGGIQVSIITELEWFVEIRQTGYLSNGEIGESMDFPYEVNWCIWPSGNIACRMKTKNESGASVTLDEMGFRLNPADDLDITLTRDNPPYLYWFGFYSDNWGAGEHDLSHDCITSPFQSDMMIYGTEENTNRIYRENYVWPDEGELVYEFLQGLSMFGVWSDVVGSADSQMRGTKLSDNYRNPDPLDGSIGAGEIIIGGGIGFDEEIGAYKLQVL